MRIAWLLVHALIPPVEAVSTVPERTALPGAAASNRLLVHVATGAAKLTVLIAVRASLETPHCAIGHSNSDGSGHSFLSLKVESSSMYLAFDIYKTEI
jgi:hypothetical protein